MGVTYLWNISKWARWQPIGLRENYKKNGKSEIAVRF